MSPHINLRPIEPGDENEMDYRGLSLVWMRRLLGLSNPKAYSVNRLIDMNMDLIEYRPPEVGECVFYDKGPHGNIGLCVEVNKVLIPTSIGIPHVYHFRWPIEPDGGYVGAAYLRSLRGKF